MSCRKTDRPQQVDDLIPTILDDKFFTTYRSDDPTEKTLVDFIKRKNSQLHFVEKTISKIGYPRWNKTIAKRKSNGNGRIANIDSAGTTFYIPFVRDSENHVNASMVIRATSSDTSFSYLCDWQYQNKVHGAPTVDSSAERFALFFMFLDKQTFGHSAFKLTDPALFSQAPPKASGKRKVQFLNVSLLTTGRVNLEEYHEVCLDFYVCGDPGWCDAHGGCDYLNCAAASGDPGHCYLVQSFCNGWWENTGGSGGGTGGGDPGGGTGGGSGGGGTPPDCNDGTGMRTMLLPPCDPGWEPYPIDPPPPTTNDPCIEAQACTAKTTALAGDQKFLNAKAQIQGADATVEHSIGFGRNAAQELTVSPMLSGGSNHGSIPPIPGGFADIHNHPGNTEPSAGDLYSLINKNTPSNGYDTRFVITGGTVYALVVYDPVKAEDFANLFPKEQIGNNPPDFPNNTNGNVFDDYLDARNAFRNRVGYSRDYADALGMAYVLEKYGAGVAVLRQNANGSFSILRVGPATSPNSTYNFDRIPCN